MARILRRDILSGRYRNGDTIPSETELKATFRTTRGTVRSAISLLVNEGLLEQVHGKGTYVRLTPLNYSIWNFGSFTDYVRTRHGVPASLVVENQIIEHEGQRLLRLVRARGVSTEAGTRYVHLDTSLVPFALFPGIDSYDFGQDSLYRVMREEYGLRPHRSELMLNSIEPDAQTRRLLEIADDVRCVPQVDGFVYDTDDRVLEQTTVVYSPEHTLKIVTLIDGGADRDDRSTGDGGVRL
jgi:GntR family transcriptional regulator